MSERLSSASHAVFQNERHFEWYTKYRYKIFNSLELINACEASIRAAAARHGIAITALSVMPEHVHCSVEIAPSMSVSRAEGLLKGASAHELFAQFPRLRYRYWGGHLWSAGRFSRSRNRLSPESVRHLFVQRDKKLASETLAAMLSTMCETPAGVSTHSFCFAGKMNTASNTKTTPTKKE